MKIVLQKYISNSGYCSRRKAEEFIKAGKAEVNGELAQPGMRVSKDDEVKVNNKIIKIKEGKVYIKINKPADITCTSRKFEGEKNIFGLLPRDLRQGLHIVGRLDKDSEGLVLITNDGDMTYRVTHPKYGHEKEYDVKLKVKSEKYKADDLILNFKKGVDIGEGDGVVKVKEIEYLKDNKFKIILTEGKKRQIRRMFEALNLKVDELTRVRIDGITLNGLKSREWKYLSKNEIDKLLNG